MLYLVKETEQRRERRHVIEAAVGSVDPPAEGRVVNLSKRGACVALDWPHAVGPRLTLSIVARDRATILHGVVRWQRQDAQGCLVGIEFG